MVCYPVVLEIFLANTDDKEMHGVIFMSNTKVKNFNTVFNFENKVFDYVEKLGYCIQRYDRISDGCSSQFWCWGTFKHLEDMTKRVPMITFHRYERYEGKNMSDALGSLIKRKSNDSALRHRLNALDEDNQADILEDMESGLEMEDLVFEDHYQAFTWLQKMMRKGSQNDTFSKNFNKIELIWVPDNEIEKDLLVKKQINKIKGIKSYNCATSVAGMKGVFVKDLSCNSCESCQKGQLLECKNERGTGNYKNFHVTKEILSRQVDIYTNSDEESEPEVEFESSVETSDESSDELEDDEVTSMPNLDVQHPGLYILLEYTERKYYVGCILSTLPGKRQIRFMQQFKANSAFVSFVWPEEEDAPIIDIETIKEKCRPLPDPIPLRRGNIQYPKYVFEGIPLSMVY